MHTYTFDTRCYAFIVHVMRKRGYEVGWKLLMPGVFQVTATGPKLTPEFAKYLTATRGLIAAECDSYRELIDLLGWTHGVKDSCWSVWSCREDILSSRSR